MIVPANGRRSTWLQLRATVARGGWATFALCLVVTKPFADAFSERTLEDRLDPGLLWSVAIVAVFAGWLLTRRRVRVEALVAVVLWVGLGVLGTAATVRWAGMPAALETGKVLAGLAPLVVWLGSRGGAEPRWGRPLVVFGLGMLVHVMVAWLQAAGVVDTTYSQTSMGRTLGRPSGLFYHPVTLGYHLVFGILFVAILERRHLLRAAIALPVAGLALVTVLVSTHRAGSLAAVLTVLAWAAAWGLTHGRRVRRTTIAVVGALVLLGLGVGTMGRDSLDAPMARLTDGVVGVLRDGDLDPTSGRFLRGRGVLWAASVDRIGDANPLRLWFGHGVQVVDPHSDYLRLPLVHGIAGSVALIALLAWAVGTLARRCDLTGAWFVAVAVGLLLTYAVTTKPTSYASFMWLWSLAVWLAAATSRPRSPGSAS